MSSRSRPSVEQASETTLLINSHDHVHGKNDNKVVHYKNIDGSRFWCFFASILLSYILVYFDGFFMASSHPVITSYFNASNAASWLSTVFFLSSTAVAPLYGRVSEITGRRPVYVVALAVFAITIGWCGSAGTIQSFIVARFFCGLGAGGVTTMSNIILSDIIKIEYRGIYQSYPNICFGLGNGLGASMGGILWDRLGWRAAFFIQLPLIVILMVFAAWAVPYDLGPSLAKAEGKTIMADLTSFDAWGAIALTLSITGLILDINLGGSILQWSHPLVIGSLVVSAFAAIGLALAEKRALRPLLPLNLLSTTPFANLNWGNLLGSALSATVNFNVPLFLQAVNQVSPTESGLLLLSPLADTSLTSVAVAFAISRTRKLKLFIAVGVMSQLVGIVACGMLSPGVPTMATIPIFPWVSIGQGFFFPASTVSTLALSSPNDQAVVVTTLNLARSLGNFLGVAFSSWILQNALLVFLNR